MRLHVRTDVGKLVERPVATRVHARVRLGVRRPVNLHGVHAQRFALAEAFVALRALQGQGVAISAPGGLSLWGATRDPTHEILRRLGVAVLALQVLLEVLVRPEHHAAALDRAVAVAFRVVAVDARVRLAVRLATERRRAVQARVRALCVLGRRGQSSGSFFAAAAANSEKLEEKLTSPVWMRWCSARRVGRV